MEPAKNPFISVFEHSHNRLIIEHLSQQIIAQVRPDEVEVSLFVMDPVIEKAAQGKVIHVGDDLEFGLGSGELLAIIVVPILVNWLGDVLKAAAQGGDATIKQRLALLDVNIQIRETDIQHLEHATGMRLKPKERHRLLQALQNRQQWGHDLMQKLTTRIRIFLSYAAADQLQVEKLHTQLAEVGFAPWMVDRDILPGVVKARAIEQAIRDADFFVACLSNHLLHTEGATWRAMRAALDQFQELPENRVFIIPARLEACEIPESLSPFYPVDLFEPDGFARLICGIILTHAQQSVQE
ncbi:MAG: toll/interleukin-1 receptor domain-containing protein [Chloroflexi bacterium]|nr:toll/interleukin-1 receptor domain-containing protein [Chloroflexota bacterium]